MVQSTVAYLAHSESVWKSNPAFVRAVADLGKALAAITADDHPPPVPDDEEPVGKAHTRELLEELTSEIADELFALSQETGEVTLAAATDFTRASLDRLSDGQLEHTALNICELAMKHVDALADYLVVAADIAELETLTHRHRSGAPDLLWVDIGSARVQANLRSACKILRGRIDKLIARYRTTAPEFVSGYHRARLLLDPEGRLDLGMVWMTRRPAEIPGEFATN